MNPKILDFVKHNLSRFIGVVLVGVVLIGGPITFYKYSFNKGYTVGYAKAIKENPTTVVQGGTVNQIQNNALKEPFALIKLWFLKLGTTF